MFARLKESGLYKMLSKKIVEKLRKEKNAVEDGKNNKKKDVKTQSLYPDAIWHRSKSARYRQN